MPDKAIDLMDESASRLRMEVDSKPEELDELDRKVIQLKIEREALKKEKDQASQDRLEKLASELEDLEAKSQALTARWQEEKAKLADATKVKEELEQARPGFGPCAKGERIRACGATAAPSYSAP